jgi:hypothetical protein
VTCVALRQGAEPPESEVEAPEVEAPEVAEKISGGSRGNGEFTGEKW